MPTKKLPIFLYSTKEVSPALLAQAIHIYHENSHQGVAKTKTRGEVRSYQAQGLQAKVLVAPVMGPNPLPFTLVEVSFLVQLVTNLLSYPLIRK